MLSDGEYTYTYNHANKLVGVTDGTNTYSYIYNGDGDRTSTTTNGTVQSYVLDLNAGLTQTLSDGTYDYVYGYDRISQVSSTGEEFFLGDQLGSVRNLVDEDGAVTLTRSYEPYGDALVDQGDGDTSYGFTGEWQEATRLMYLRARYYSRSIGRFMSRDSWMGNQNKPMSYNLWLYGFQNPVLYLDPSGYSSCTQVGDWDCDTVSTVLLYKDAFLDSASRHNQIPSMDDNSFAALIASIMASELRMGGRVSNPRTIEEIDKQNLEDIVVLEGCLTSGHIIESAKNDPNNKWYDLVGIVFSEYLSPTIIGNLGIDYEYPSQAATIGIGNVWLDTALNVRNGLACPSIGVCTAVEVELDVPEISDDLSESQMWREIGIELLANTNNIEYVAANLEAGALRMIALGETPTAFTSAAWHMKGLETRKEISDSKWQVGPFGPLLEVEELQNALQIWGLTTTWDTSMDEEYEFWKSQY